MNAGPEDSEDVEDDNNTGDYEQEDEENESEGEGETGEDSEDNNNRTASTFGILSSLQNMRAALEPVHSLNISNLIDSETLRMLQDPIGPDLRRTLAQPVIEPEVIRQIQQPVVDPEVIHQIQQPVIAPELLRSLRQPVIDPDLIEALQSLSNSTTLNLYRTAAALEQLEQENVEEPEQISEEDLEDELEDDPEPPREGGVLSTFFNATAIILLNQPDGYSEESIDALHNLLQSESVQSKTAAFRDFISSAGTTASQAVILATSTAFQLSWGMHFAGDLEENVTDANADEDENELDRDDN
ncbi:MAG: hypothetical protein ABEI86_02985 [Halobacteriaceae archaeon]